MTLLGFDGFDTYDATTGGVSNVLSNWSLPSGGNNPDFNATYGRFGGGGVKMVSGSSRALVKVAALTASCCVGCSMNFNGNSGTSTDDMLLALKEGTTTHLQIQATVGGAIQLQRGTTTIATSSVITGLFGNWHFIELVGTIADSGGVGQVYVDGTKVIDFSGDTRNGGTAGIPDRFEFGPGSGTGGFSNTIDDVYWCSGTTPLGECRVDTLVPNADTAQKDFTTSTGTTHYTLVDDVPPNGDTDYVVSGTSGNKDLYDIASLPTTSASIFGVNVSSVVRKDDVGTVNYKNSIKSGSTSDASGAIAPSTSYAPKATLWATDPATSAAWLDAAITALQIGVEIV